jgi:cell division cycle protein 37
MPVDYSKWVCHILHSPGTYGIQITPPARLISFKDALELSDDSDIEVHPNVDKRSFIRAKQNQIHQQRFERKHQIETLKYERIINDGFLRRIDGLLTSLQSHKAESEKRSPDELMFQSIMESVGDPDEDQPPPRPEGVHTGEKELPTFSKMMATLVDQVKAEVDKTNPENRFDSYVAEVKEHRKKVDSLQKQLLSKLNELEREEGRKITSESIHTGFDSSYVNKAEKKPATAPSSTSTTTTKPKSEKVQAVELLNPGAVKDFGDKGQSSGADADIDEPVGGEDDDDVQPTELGKKFAQIKPGDYRAMLQFISENPTVVAERETDGLLVLAFNSQLEGNGDFARQCVHQALLLQYCRSLGRDGVGLFFKRITTKGHQAQKVFMDDVNETYNRIKTRTKEISAQREKEEAEGPGVEQIQLHAVDPGTTINITIPEKDSTDPDVKKARYIFESFPPGLQRALESGSLDEVNIVLGKMSVEEAEAIVGQLGEVCISRFQSHQP